MKHFILLFTLAVSMISATFVQALTIDEMEPTPEALSFMIPEMKPTEVGLSTAMIWYKGLSVTEKKDFRTACVMYGELFWQQAPKAMCEILKLNQNAGNLA
ncbi:MAG: hypothetical protein HRU20_06310 [Pseudomonadales bacterium]|nr:hypothetical protein [Pseudomonadales bacterium]